MKTVKYDNPIFYEKAVQELNEELEFLGWIQHQYPIVRLGETDEGTFPEVYYNDGGMKNLRVMPHGNSISFFRIEGELTQVDEMWWNFPLSLTVWVDLRKIHVRNYDYTTELMADVIDILERKSCSDIVIITDNVFDGYSFLEKKLSQNTMRPFAAFKINFNYMYIGTLRGCADLPSTRKILITEDGIYITTEDGIEITT